MAGVTARPAAATGQGGPVTLALPHRLDHRGDAVAWGRLGSGPPLVLIHGTPFSSQVWRRIVPWLAHRWTVHWFDLLGYGQSDERAGQDVSLGAQNGLLAALFDEWGLGRPTVLAHDIGGATALRAWHVAKRIAGGRLTVVPECGHLMQEDAPEAIVAAMLGPA